MKALGLMVLEKKIFKSFPIYFNVKLLTPGAGPFLAPMEILSTIYVEDLWMLLYTKYESSRPCGFGGEDF